MKVILMRGLPGTGKSSYLRAKFQQGVVICSADDYPGRYLYDGEGKVVKYNNHLSGDAHAACYALFFEALEQGQKLIAVDNTNVLREHLTPYIALAQYRGAEVEVVEMSAKSRFLREKQNDEDYVEYLARINKHAVPLHAIEKMDESWEALSPYHQVKVIVQRT